MGDKSKFEKIATLSSFLGGITSFIIAVSALLGGMYAISEESKKLDTAIVQKLPVSEIVNLVKETYNLKINSAKKDAAQIIAKAERDAADKMAKAQIEYANLISKGSKDRKNILETARITAQRIRDEAQAKVDEDLKKVREIGISNESSGFVQKEIIEGWCFIGRFSKKYGWLHRNIELNGDKKNFSSQTPTIGDKVILSKALNLRSGRPHFPLYRMESLIIPSLPKGTELTIREIDNFVGVDDYTWAKVELEWPIIESGLTK